jgi:MoaA/NifB/PqqE/SkfB family radical SAM enzyme
MFKIIDKQHLTCLTEKERLSLYEIGEGLIVPLEAASQDFLSEVSNHASVWLGEEKCLALDARRLLEEAEWLVPILTSDFLPKTLILAPHRWNKREFCATIPHLNLEHFYNWTAIHTDYEGAFELIFRHSLYFHHAQISNTDFCNLKCRGCAYHGEDPRYGFAATRALRRRREMKPADYYTYIDQLPPGKDVLFCPSGEIFVSGNAIDYIKYACQKNLYVRILTNGMLLTPDISKYLLEWGVAAVIFSIDGHRADLVENIRIGINFKKVIDNLKQLQKIRDQSGSNMVIGVQSGWFEELRPFKEEMITFWRELGVDSLAFFEEKIDLFTDKRILDIKNTHLNFSLPCFKTLVTAPLMTDGKIAPCSHHMPIAWSKLDTSWMKSVSDGSIDEIHKYYRQMRLDPDSPYRRNCAKCQSKMYCYMKRDQTNLSVDAYRFTNRRTAGEAAFVKEIK